LRSLTVGRNSMSFPECRSCSPREKCFSSAARAVGTDVGIAASAAAAATSVRRHLWRLTELGCWPPPRSMARCGPSHDPRSKGGDRIAVGERLRARCTSCWLQEMGLWLLHRRNLVLWRHQRSLGRERLRPHCRNGHIAECSSEPRLILWR